VSYDNGGVWHAIGIADSALTWAVPDSVSDQCYIAVTGLNAPFASDTTGVFSIQSAPSIEVLAPAVDDSLMAGHITTVRWSVTNVDSVAVSYSADGKASWTQITKLAHTDSTLDWIVPDSTSNDCYIRVSALEDTTVTGVSGRFSIISDPTSVDEIPTVYELSHAYPNPFNPTTTIDYALPSASHVRLVVYNVMGQQVDVLVDDMRSAGRYSIHWNAAGMSSGIYFYRIQADGFSERGKMLLMK
jgi:hypothetical protein